MKNSQKNSSFVTQLSRFCINSSKYFSSLRLVWIFFKPNIQCLIIYIKFALQQCTNVRAKTNILRNTAILKQILLEVFAFFELYPNIVHMATGIELFAVFEPAQLPQETICPSVAFAKGRIGNSRGQSIIYYNINTFFVLSNKLSFCCPRKNKTLVKQCCGCGKCKFSFIFTVCKFTLIDQTETCCVIAQLNIHLSAL